MEDIDEQEEEEKEEEILGNNNDNDDAQYDDAIGFYDRENNKNAVELESPCNNAENTAKFIDNKRKMLQKN